MKILALFSFFIFLMQSDLHLVKQFPAPSDYVLTDALGTLYSVKGNCITSYDEKGKKLFSYSNPFLGEISYADVKNPMRILLFYKEFNQVIFLSNKLSELGSSIELDNTGHNQVSICCTSNSGGFWLFDQQSLQLIHLNSGLEPIQKGTILQNIFKNSSELPVCLVEENDEIYMSLPKTGLLVFDKFGTYQKSIPITNVHNFQVLNDKIFYFENNYLYSSSNTMEKDSVLFPENLKIISAAIYKNQIVASSKEEIFIFNLQN
jgi:hypothetical protein